MMRKKMKCLPLLALLMSACSTEKPDGTITVDFNAKGADIPTSMYGIFFEEINHSGDGGLYAELVQNRGFEDTSIPEGYRVEGNLLFPPEVHNHLTGQKPAGRHHYRWPTEEIPAWELKQVQGTGASMELTRQQPLHPATPTSLSVNLPGTDSRVTLSNSGFWGMNIVNGENYLLRFYARKDGQYAGKLTVSLVSPEGKILSEDQLTLKGDPGWNEYKMTIQPKDSSHQGKLMFTFEGAGHVWMDYVSLFPENTFMNRPNGLRNDVAKVLQDMKPAFIRWPGGCIVEGISLSNRIQWKQTIGDPMTRPGMYDTWGYRSTMGFGYHEFLQYCEDIHADGMFVCNAGIGCQGRVGDACSEKDLQHFIDEALDAIEYALGDETTEWGKKRVENGHSQPFPLKYVEIGNENWGGVYAKRYDKFYKAIKAKYPDLTLISTLGLGGQKEHEKVDMIDPHWYVAPDMFFMNDKLFDEQPRGDYKIYVGEYACNIGVGGGNLLGALGEAAFLTGMERNSDLVKMASYAPLLENVNDRVWPVNLIWLDSYRVMGRSSYHVQKMYADNRPSYNLNTTITQPRMPVKVNGKIGLGTWETQAEFKDLKITSSDGIITTVDLTKTDLEWTPKAGEWSSKDGMYIQTGTGSQRWTTWDKTKFNQCTIEFKARKISGNEGFFLYFGVENEDGYTLNIGGWGNRKTAFEKMNNGGLSQMTGEVAQHIEEGRWYDFQVVLADSMFTYYCDGQKMLEMPVIREQRYSIAGFDTTTNEIIVKVINAESVPFKTTIDLKNVQVESSGKIITLSSVSELDENDLDHPDKVIPVEKTYDKFKSSFSYTFEPWSFNIMRIKVKGGK